MTILGRWNQYPVSINLNASSFTISIEYPTHSDVFSFDHQGRPWTSLIEETSYRRGLDGRTVAKWISLDGTRQRRWLLPEEAERIAEQARNTAMKLYDAHVDGSLELSEPISPGNLIVFEKAMRFDTQARKNEKLKFDQIYLPVGILPPDQYGAVLLQATEGCSFNACTFCTFYKDRRFHIKTPQEYENHCEAVKAFLGNGLSLRRTIFLGDANSLVIPMKHLITLFEITHQYYDVEALGGIFAFLDGVSGEKKSAQDYALLASMGLKRVYIGLESGSNDLLRYLHKPNTAQEVVNTVKLLKQGGVSVGIILLLGAGGKKFAKAHIKDSITVLNEMQLGFDDIIYFSELVESEAVEYQKQAYSQHLSPLNQQERIEQQAAIETKLRFTIENGTPHISRYDIREFVY